MNTTAPRIIDPSRPRLPLMDSIHDAAKLNEKEHTTFYVSAWLFQAWISELILGCSAQFAEKTAPNERSFQAGQAWQGFQKIFDKPSDKEFAQIFQHLMKFAGYDDSLAEYLLEASAPLAIEHELTREFLGKHTPQGFRNDRKKLLSLFRSTTMRLCDWLDSLCHFRVLLEWHFMPDCFDPDPKKRELAHLGKNKLHFDLMNEHSQVHWLSHMSDLLDDLKDSPDNRAAYAKAAAGPEPEPRPWSTDQLDLTIVKLWPLLKHHHWSAPTLLCVLRKLLDPKQLAACPDELALINHCENVLSLRHASLASKNSCSSEPPGFIVARRIAIIQPETDTSAPPV
jgi:hypothetical protein